jgi:hypothetical protein
MNAPPPADSYTGPAPDRPRCPNTACADSGSPRPWTSAPTTAGTAGCAVTATPYPRCWLPALISPTRKTRAPRGSTTHLPTPCAMGWPPSKSGRVQSTGTSRHHHLMRDRPGPAATTRWPLLNTRHSAHPRTDPDPFLDVAGPAEKDSHQSCLAPHDPITGQLLVQAADHFGRAAKLAQV